MIKHCIPQAISMEKPPITVISVKSHLWLSKIWMGVAVASLILAGLFSLVLVIGRAPILNQLIRDPLWAKKCLVIHVNLALGVWFFSFLASLFCLLPGSIQKSDWRWKLGILGIGIFAGLGFFLKAKPVLSNYIPVLNHWIFLLGLFIFYLSIGLTFFNRQIFSSREKKPARSNPLPLISQVGIKTAALSYLFALALLATSLLLTPTDLLTRTYYEVVFWGGGHIFQFVNVTAMIAVWLALITRILGEPPFSLWGARFFFGLLFLSVIISPFFMIQGTTSSLYYSGFTSLMRWGIWPSVLLLLVFCIKAFYQSWKRGVIKRKDLGSPFFTGWVSSALLTLVGFTLGAMISTSTTLIPAHYHAAIGAVTVAYMSMAYLLMETYGWAIPTDRLRKLSLWQPGIFGTGQLVFSLGFAYAGLHGLGRKVYGHEQHLRSTEECIGLAIMGMGGILAIMGGILFLVILGKCWFQKEPMVQETF